MATVRLHKGGGKRGHNVEDTLLLMMFLGWANERDTNICFFHAAQTGKLLLRTQNVSDKNQKQFLCLGHKFCVRNKCCARGQTGKHLCPQHCVLVCHHLKGCRVVLRILMLSLWFVSRSFLLTGKRRQN